MSSMQNYKLSKPACNCKRCKSETYDPIQGAGRNIDKEDAHREIVSELQPAGVNDFERGMADGYKRRRPESNGSDDYNHGYYVGLDDDEYDGYAEATYTTETPA